MANQHANHSINDFKQFVKKHPKLIKEVRKEQRSWQDVYENWVLFGESDPIWDPYREPEEASLGNLNVLTLRLMITIGGYTIKVRINISKSGY